MTTETEPDLLQIMQAPESLPVVVAAREMAESTARMFAADYPVTSNDHFEAAAEDLRMVKSRLDDLDQLEDHIMSPLKEHAKRLKALFAVPRERLQQAKGAIERPMVAYQSQVRREREEAERAMLEAARAERQRQADEARRAADAASARRAELEAAAAQAADADALTTASRELQAAEDAEQSAAEALHAVESTPLQLPTASLPEIPKAAGTQTRVRWSGTPEAGDEPAALVKLVRAAAADPSYMGFLQVNQVAINQTATALKSHARVPGFVFAPVTSIASSRAKR